ncbi:hypothetical protein C2W64_01908 [Brevibacillus laterosporus]|nr:hypothetical protein C2W64_01908 [Brevibacillus laterosporus]
MCAVASDKPTDTISTTSSVQNEEQPKIQIDDKLIQRATEYVKSGDYVKDAAIAVEGPRASLVVTVDYAVNKETAKNIADNFVRTLGSEAGGKSPTRDYYGEVYDYYDILVTVITPDGKEVLLGAKVTSASNIRWNS